MTCPECKGLGYLLNERHAGEGNNTGPLTLNLTGCFYPPCDAPERPIASFQVMGMFTDVVKHPSTGAVMALTGFTERICR